MPKKINCKLCGDSHAVLKRNKGKGEYYDVCKCFVKKVAKTITKKFKFNKQNMKEKLIRGTQTHFEWENGRLVFNTVEDATSYFKETEPHLKDFDRWAENSNIKIRN